MQNIRLLFLGIFLLVAGSGYAQSVEFTVDQELRTSDGYVKLEWDGGVDKTYILQKATDSEFSDAITIYQGPDKATFISGLRDGIYYYRV